MKKIFLIILLFVPGMLVAEPAAEQSVEAEQKTEIRNMHFSNIDELVALRAPGLALSYVQRQQPAYTKEDPVEWLLWEQKRILLLKYMQRWQAINDRIEEQYKKFNIPKVATADRNWFKTEQLRALVALKQYPLALHKTRELLWNASSLVKSSTFAAWRRIIIQIYIQQQQTQDAQIAMRRYQQDYGELQNEDGFSWLQLQAELFIQLHQYDEAIRILKPVDSAAARTLQLLAMLHDNAISALDIIDNTDILLTANDEDVQSRLHYQYLAMVAHYRLGKLDRAIELLEQLLVAEQQVIGETVIQLGGIDLDADALWELYLQNGNNYANKEGLLKGDDEAWYVLASKLFESKAVTASSLFAVLALQAGDENHRQLSMQQLEKIIATKQSPLKLLNQLFTESKYIADVNHVPYEIRYQLIDHNLLQGQIRAAAALMADLQQPPAEQPQFQWNLRRARVLILSGSFEQGAMLLSEMLETQELQKDQADKYLQVVFDLQAVEQHILSLKLFSQLQSRVDDPLLQRELTFWQAESYAGLKQYDKAAYLFLRSAQSPDLVYDPWYHTATFRAAESLMEAGLYEDARQRFLHLLKITGNAARKAVIRQRLQAIQLKSQVK